MLYTSLEALLQAASQIELDDDESLKQLGKLLQVYHKALINPPDGMIGVGAITYAEETLLEYQFLNGALGESLERWESESCYRGAQARWNYHEQNDTLDLY